MSLLASLLAGLLTASCAGLSFKRETQTSGRFTSTGLAFTILSIDMPKRALDIARENASDANLSHMKVESAFVFPYLGPVDFLIDIIGIRFARISGTWGFDEE